MTEPIITYRIVDPHARTVEVHANSIKFKIVDAPTKLAAWAKLMGIEMKSLTDADMANFFNNESLKIN